MKKLNIKGKSSKDLHKMLSEKRNELREFRFGISGSKVKNVLTGRNTRRDVARILTGLNADK